jgi:hypothetical protein
MAERGIIDLLEPGIDYTEPLVQYSTSEKSVHAENLQRSLNQCLGIYVNEDGHPAEKTSDAFKKNSRVLPLW